MTDTAETLVLRHLADIEGAIRFIETSLEPKLWRAVADRLERWAAANGWEGNTDPDSDEDFWLAPDEWRTVGGEPDEHDFWLSTDTNWGDANESDATDLACLIGASPVGNRMTLALCRNVANKKSVWREVLAGADPVLSQLRGLGFEIDSRQGRISHLLDLDAAILGRAFAEDDFAAALKPLEDILVKLPEARPLFDSLLAKARTMA